MHFLTQTQNIRNCRSKKMEHPQKLLMIFTNFVSPFPYKNSPKEVERQIFILINFGYILIFAILGVACLLVKIPKESGMEYYIKARKTLGWSQIMMAIYCVARLILMQYRYYFEEFWVLCIFTLIFSYMTYVSILFLIETPRYLTRNMFIDIVIPIIIMAVIGAIGWMYEPVRMITKICFGVIFAAKCIRMFYVCDKEYNICKKDVDNYFGSRPDIKWIRTALYSALLLSFLTLLSFYIKAIHLIFYIMIPVIYTYVVIKVINFMPATLDRARNANAEQERKDSDAKDEKTKDIVEKIAPKVDEWVSRKGFCTPEMTIKDVAMQMGTNHNYLSTYLNKHLNMTFQVWLNTLRVEESKKILTSGEDLSIEEVGIKVGFSQNYNFSRWFRVITDMTPYQYRRQNS